MALPARAPGPRAIDRRVEIELHAFVIAKKRRYETSRTKTGSGGTMNPLGFIYSLSLRVFHRCDSERIFVILTAYMDETAVHRGAQKTVMAGYISYAETCREFLNTC